MRGCRPPSPSVLLGPSWASSGEAVRADAPSVPTCSLGVSGWGPSVGTTPSGVSTSAETMSTVEGNRARSGFRANPRTGSSRAARSWTSAFPTLPVAPVTRIRYAIQGVDERLAAGHLEHRTRHLPVGHEEHRGVGDVVGRVHALDRHRLGDTPAQLVSLRRGRERPHVAVGVAGSDGGDAPRAELDRQWRRFRTRREPATRMGRRGRAPSLVTEAGECPAQK
jgi:hypothetical protein